QQGQQQGQQGQQLQQVISRVCNIRTTPGPY
nr:napin large chain L2B - Swedish turnip (fragments) [Brassica napus subsp. rapifera]